MPIEHIVIGKCTIRDWREDDAASIAQYANNKKIWINLRDAFPHPYTMADAEAFLSKVMRMEPRTYFAIALDHEAIGSIGLMPGDDVHRFTAELGYWLAEPFWGNGIMTNAIRALNEYAFEELGLHRIFAEPYTANAASARVLEKSGFTLEGIIRAAVFKEGRILDQYLYAKHSKSALRQDSSTIGK
ncbi:Acetyltransferase (GNAT) domain protein [uncultured archaeon]|nr:Acetyltransferase (GNAT) domain protein [uncultured archaeon]